MARRKRSRASSWEGSRPRWTWCDCRSNRPREGGCRFQRRWTPGRGRGDPITAETSVYGFSGCNGGGRRQGEGARRKRSPAWSWAGSRPRWTCCVCRNRWLRGSGYRFHPRLPPGTRRGDPAAADTNACGFSGCNGGLISVTSSSPV